MFAFSAAFRENSRLPPALPEEDSEFSKFCLVNFLCYTFKPQKNRANSFFLVRKARFLRELFWCRRAYYCTKEYAVEGPRKTSFCRIAALMYQHSLGATIFAKQTGQTDYRGYAIFDKIQNIFSGCKGRFLVSGLPPYFVSTVFRDFLEVMRSTFKVKCEMRAEMTKSL